MYVRVVRRELASGHLRSINGGCHGRARVDWTGMMDSQSALQSRDMACHWCGLLRNVVVQFDEVSKKYTTFRPSASSIIHHHDHAHLASDCTQTRTAASRPNTAIITPTPVRARVLDPCLGPVSWTPSTAWADRRAPETLAQRAQDLAVC